MAFRPYLRDRLIEDQPEGFVVIVPTDAAPPVPLACPVCTRLMRTRDDEASWRTLECCDRCALIWAQPRQAAWKEGWRPTQEQVHQADVQRPPMAITFDVD
jgi:hypothetical protein